MENKEMRAVYCDTLKSLAAADPRIMVLEADLMKASGTMPFKAAYPDRGIDAGVAEANMVGVAAGLASEGKIPFAATFGCFASRRDFDQFFLSGAYAKLPVKLVGTDPGVTAAFNGGTHMPFEDIGIMRNVPGLDIVEPSDAVSLEAYVRLLAASGKPAYLRLHRKAVEPIYKEGEKFELGRGKLLREGRDLVIVSLGALMTHEALSAAKLLASKGIEAAVIDALCVKPIDEKLILDWGRKTGAVLSVENHQCTTGLGGALAWLLAGRDGIRFDSVGIHDEFGEVGTLEYLQQRFKLTAGDIAAKAEKLAKV